MKLKLLLTGLVVTRDVVRFVVGKICSIRFYSRRVDKSKLLPTPVQKGLFHYMAMVASYSLNLPQSMGSRVFGILSDIINPSTFMYIFR